MGSLITGIWLIRLLPIIITIAFFIIRWRMSQARVKAALAHYAKEEGQKLTYHWGPGDEPGRR